MAGAQEPAPIRMARFILIFQRRWPSPNRLVRPSPIDQLFHQSVAALPGSDHGLGDAMFVSWTAVMDNHHDAGSAPRPGVYALARYGQAKIFQTSRSQRSQSHQPRRFTGDWLKNASIRISMDGRGRCMDNIFIERLWRSLKYEAVYLHELTDGFHARTGHRRVDRLLQHRAAPFVPRRSNAGRGLRGRSTWWI